MSVYDFGSQGPGIDPRAVPKSDAMRICKYLPLLSYVLCYIMCLIVVSVSTIVKLQH